MFAKLGTGTYLGIGHFVILLDDLTESGVVDLHVGLEVRELDIEIRYTALEEQPGIVCVVVSGCPNGVRVCRGETLTKVAVRA